MVRRSFWLNKVESFLERRSILWLTGVRRVGKTFLCKSLENTEYFDCELVKTRRQLSDPEEFLAKLMGKRIILDEIHRLDNPSQVLKIAADHFAGVDVIATGSSTLQASTKFKDTLTGRKYELWLTPMNECDLRDFNNPDLDHRMLMGGLPPFFMAEQPEGTDFQEWIDSYWAKDVQELFRLELFSPFQRLLELLAVNSGGIFEATYYAERCEISRQTVTNYLKAIEATAVAQLIRPFSSRRAHEIVSAPKSYFFDTGFVCYMRDWRQLRDEDRGNLWEHLVLNELNAALGTRTVNYWRDKRGHEIDFVIRQRGKDPKPLAIECKWSADSLDLSGLKSFRSVYRKGSNWAVCANVDRSFSKKFGDHTVDFIGLGELSNRLRNNDQA